MWEAWQKSTDNCGAERYRREVHDHIIPVNEDHLRRLIRDYVRYYQ
jgi:hypothetical protein